MSLSESSTLDFSTSTSTAGYLTSGNSAYGTLNSVDADAFKVAFTAGTSYEIGFGGFAWTGAPAVGPMLITIQNASGTQTWQTQGSGVFTISVTLTDTYYVIVEQLNAGPTGSYGLFYNAQGVVDDYVGDYSPVNPAFAQMLPTAPPTTISGELNFAGDSDGFRATLELGKTYYYQVSSPDMQVVVQRPDGTTVYSTTSGDASSGAFLSQVAGDVWVVASAKPSMLAATGSYQVEFGRSLDSETGFVALIGSPSGDTLSAFSSSSRNDIRGGWGDDFIVGSRQQDYLFGGSGNDTLDSGNSPGSTAPFGDMYDGGAGDDTYVIRTFNDRIANDAGGTDTYKSYINDVSMSMQGDIENGQLMVQGGELIGNDSANRMSVEHSGGNSILRGGGGNDTIIGGSGNETLYGDAGNDLLQGGVTIQASGSNVLDGGAGADTMVGGSQGGDKYIVDDVGDVIQNYQFTLQFRDIVESSISWTLGSYLEQLTLTGSESINGTGSAFADSINGNTGANILDGGAGSDTLNGGAGNDTYVVDAVSDVISELSTVATEIDGVQSSLAWTLGNNLEKLTLTGAAAISGTGNILNNVINGNSANNALNGGDGNDSISGGGGVDTLTGGAGNDTYTVDSTTDALVEASGGGTDRVSSSVSFTLGTQIENLTLTGLSAINGTGNTLNNTIVGNAGANVLSGGGGVDTLTGGAGNDVYAVDSALDTLVESAVGGIDRVGSSVTFTLGAEFETLSLNGTAAINGTGNTLGNLIVGNTANNVIDGGAGQDTLNGGAGDDTLNPGGGNDTLDGGLGNDTYDLTTSTLLPPDFVGPPNWNEGRSLVFIESSSSATEIDTILEDASFTLPDGYIENLQLTGTFAASGTGNSLSNKIFGNSAGNLLSGGSETPPDLLNSLPGVTSGDDSLYGGLGNDTLQGSSAGSLSVDLLDGGAGNDLYIVNSATDIISEASTLATEIDTVTSTVTWTLGANLERLTQSGSGAINGTGNALNNMLTGNAGNNTLFASSGNDTLAGGSGNDILIGGTGNDVVDGGVGSDTIRFSNAATSINIDTVNNYVVVDDRIELASSVFTQLTTLGALSAANFKASLTGDAADSTDYVLYETDTGNLYYDSDGTGAAAKLLMATFGAAPVLTNLEFFVT